MTIEEAIAILTGEREYSQSEFNAAVRLGIEALKLIKRNRRYTPQPYNIKLPGETDS